ncbi:MAG: hypothetical protein LUE64_01420 [Candidatus Gastranaerophilales bacterium]|nr:hypothetical protein [Candidatus Gastranaerophilales bacterium]
MFKKISNILNWLKVAAVLTAVFFALFWFYRFFNLPFAENISSCVDILLVPVKAHINTIKVADNHILEFGYVGLSVLFAFLSFMFGKLVFLNEILEQKWLISDMEKRQLDEEELNQKLEKDYYDELRRYKFFSVYLKYKIEYINEVIAQNNAYTIAEIVQRSYKNTADYIRKKRPEMGLRVNKASIFARNSGYNDFDKCLIAILGAIKETIEQNEHDSMSTKFLFVIDAQRTDYESSKSHLRMAKIADSLYYDKAVATSAFKQRFDLIQPKSKFKIELLGVAALDSNNNDTEELYVLKSKTW